jgi:xanthine dehydrogenase accessory factor
MVTTVVLRGGGDLATGIAMRLHKAGIQLVIAELAKPLAVRRTVSFCEAVYSGVIEVEGIKAYLISKQAEASDVIAAGEIPVLVDPNLIGLADLSREVLIDARMTKRAPDVIANAANLVVGLGPGFVAGENCHAVVETMRGHNLGRVFWQGGALADTGIPGSIASHSRDRVLRAPAAGRLEPAAEIGQQLKAGDLIATVAGQELRAGFDGVLRGLIHSSVDVVSGMKIGDLDPRNDPSFAFRVSDKSLAIGGGVLEALLTRPEIRAKLWA